jgi:uncharacterized protein affecting Mg2+/Co2+ transport
MADKSKGLTIKQEKFVQNLFAGMSQREAYRQSFNCEKMADKTIDEAASRLAGDSKVIARLAELTDELKQKNMVTVQRVVDELAHIAFDDISKYLSYKTVKTVVGTDTETGDPIIGYRTVVELNDSNTVDTRSIAEVSIGHNGTFRFKQYCKDAALVKLGEYLGMFKQNININGVIPVKIVDDIE